MLTMNMPAQLLIQNFKQPPVFAEKSNCMVVQSNHIPVFLRTIGTVLASFHSLGVHAI